MYNNFRINQINRKKINKNIESNSFSSDHKNYFNICN